MSSDGQETALSGLGGPGDPMQEEVRARAVELGFLSEAQASDAFGEYSAQGGPRNFASFLLEKGLVSLDQAGQLAPEDDADVGASTVIQDPGDVDAIVGQEFSGCRVERKLGQGGMGSVYLARRAEGDHEVVIKFLAPDQVNNTTWRGRFLREAELLKRIHHPNIVEIFSVEGEGDRPHIVMEFVDGQALDAVLEERGLVEPREAARIARDVALALHEAHQSGVIHRDIKPANVLLDREGTVKMLDFGLAKNLAVDDGLSMPGQVLGTPHYMAPEQWGDHEVDARADVFSLGSTLYHLVTGTLPFPGHNPQSISRKILEGDFVPPHELVPEIPEDLEFVLFRMLEPERRFRYRSAQECAEDLARVLADQPVEVARLVDRSSGRRFPLLPGSRFTIGRDEGNAIMIADGSVSRQHAEIERVQTGFLLRDLGSTYGTYVGGMRVREVVLKDEDPIKLGKVALSFHDGGLGLVLAPTTRRLAPERLRVTSVPQPFMQALVESSDKRAVVHLLELLAPDARELRLGQARQVLTAVVPGDVAEEAYKKVQARLRRQQSMVPMQLFSITHENLGDDTESWLTWWDHSRERYPAQVGPQQPTPRARLRLIKGEPEERTIPLEGRPTWAVGREERSDVALNSRSVSRLHATLLRYHTRVVIRDEGSRFGTTVNGRRVRMAFLGQGDRIVMGKVELVFQVERLDPTATLGDRDRVSVDPEVYFALEDLRHASAASALVAFMEMERSSSAWLERGAASLFPDADPGPYLEKVQKLYARRAKIARSALPGMLGAELGDDPAAWRQHLVEHDAELPPQVVPIGWFPMARSGA